MMQEIDTSTSFSAWRTLSARVSLCRVSGIGWVIILREKSGREHVLEHVDLFFNDSSVTVAWYGKAWPCLAALSALDLCGVVPVFPDWPRPPAKNG